jgi:hypothetical protein
MNAGTVSSGMTISRLTVRWRVDAELRDADRGRLDGLVRGLCDGPLEDALMDTSGGHPAEVCVRRVVVPAHRVRWDCADADLVSGWAQAIGHAVRGSMIPGGDVVRFASRSHAQADLIVSVLAGDRERLWAWQLLGLWPAAATDAEAVSSTVAAAVDERPGALVALVVAAARAGQLGRFVEYVGPDALAGFTRRLWLAAGGTLPPDPRATAPDGAADAALAGRLAALLRQRSEIIAYALRLPAARLAASAGSPASGPAAALGVATVPPSPAAPGPLAEPAAGSVAESLAVLAVLETEPAMAAHPDAWTAVAATARALRATAGEPRASSATPGGVPRPDHQPGAATPEATRSATRPRSPRDVPPAPRLQGEPDGARAQARPVTDGGAAPVPPGAAGAASWGGLATSWGGLLFLLPVVAELGIPASVAAQPDAYGVGLRPVLHELGRQLLVRAAPDAEPAGADDPARLAFCGLSPRSDAPRPPEPRARELIGLDAGSVVAALRERLPEPAPDRGDSALLLSVCRRHAVINADPGWIDVDLRLDEVSVDVRRAGLDLDPGYLPWLGCVVRFRYV